MKGRGSDSDYLITRLFSTTYFHYYSKPSIFAAYFLPFVAYGKNRAYLESEFEEKLSNIENNRHGNFYNFSTQGLGNVALDEKCITFHYFYKKLCNYEMDKNKFFDSNDKLESLESDIMRDDLKYVLSKEGLLLKRKVYVKKHIKEKLLSDLKIYEVKYVLGKLLYYIVCEEHILPDVEKEASKLISKKLGLDYFENNLNVFMASRKEIEDDAESLYDRIKDAVEIQILCQDGISLFGDCTIGKMNDDFYYVFKKILKQNENVSIEIILSDPESYAYKEASCYQTNISHLKKPKSELVKNTISRIKKLQNEIPFENIMMKYTDKMLPYALFGVKYQDRISNYIKIDIYSPLINENSDRPSMYIFQETTPELYNHFSDVFDKMWKYDSYASFI